MTAATEPGIETGTRLEVTVQRALDDNDGEEPPADSRLARWAECAYSAVRSDPSEVTIRLVDETEITRLNNTYRNKNQPTNVLSFPCELDPMVEVSLLGDIVICHSVLDREAESQQKSLHDHYAHMVVHGILHLCGFDHQDESSAREMEALEVSVLAEQGIADPYA